MGERTEDIVIYGGIEPEITKLINGEFIDLDEKAYFNLLSHRDAAIAMILAKRLASNHVSTFNLSGHTVDVRKAAEAAAKELRSYPQYSKVRAKFTGTPADAHLLADGSVLEGKLGKPVDSLDSIIRSQVFWIANNGWRRGLNHKIGKLM